MSGSGESVCCLTKRLVIAGISIDLVGRPSDTYFNGAEAKVGDSLFLATTAKYLSSKPGVIIDIGANIGLTSSLLAKIRPDDKIYAIEPSSKSFSALKATISINKLSNVNAINVGFGAEAGRFILNEDPSNSSAANFSGGASLENDDPRGVIVQTLDQFCSAHEIRPHFLKLDVEGFESNVLKGGSKIIRECSPILFLELNSFTMLAYGRVSPLDFICSLREKFREILWLNDEGIDKINSDAKLVEFLHIHYTRNCGVDDLLCIPDGAAIDVDALAADAKQLNLGPSSATSARLEAVLNSTTWKIAKKIQRFVEPFKRKPHPPI